MTTHVTARSPEDLLALAPVLLGFWPSDDVVMMTFGGPRPFHARLDLPERASTQDLRRIEETMLGPASSHEVRAVALLLYGAHERIVRAVCRVLRAGARRRGLEVLVCLWADDGAFRFVGGPAGVSAPFAYDVSNHPYVVEAVVEGRLAFRSRAEMVASLEPDPARVLSVTGAWPDEELDQRRSLARLRRLVAAEQPVSDDDLAWLVGTVCSIEGRDAAMMLVDRANADAHRRLWASVLPRTPEAHVPAVADLLAFTSWQAGDGALAWAAIDRARRASPDDRLAGLLARLLEDAVPPDAWPA